MYITMYSTLIIELLFELPNGNNGISLCVP